MKALIVFFVRNSFQGFLSTDAIIILSTILFFLIFYHFRNYSILFFILSHLIDCGKNFMEAINQLSLQNFFENELDLVKTFHLDKHEKEISKGKLRTSKCFKINNSFEGFRFSMSVFWKSHTLRGKFKSFYSSAWLVILHVNKQFIACNKSDFWVLSVENKHVSVFNRRKKLNKCET